jgi:L-asparagine transporter-like permease
MKLLGWILFLPALLIHLLSILNYIVLDDYLNIQVFAIYSDTIGDKSDIFKIIIDSFSYELLSIATIISIILIGFSKLKIEDEFTSKIRYESLVWATYFNYALLIFFTLFVYGIAFLNVLAYNIYTFLIFFIIRFYFRLYQLQKASENEE